MKHIFFAFPAGIPGLALATLRLSAALWVAVAAVHVSSTSTLETAVLGLLSSGLVVGFSTRLISGACAVGATICAAAIESFASICVVGTVFEMIALTLIGPGAYSVDAAMYGRRTIHLPD